jgi:glycosyltransferase involved in cell wall biosynthesis
MAVAHKDQANISFIKARSLDYVPTRMLEVEIGQPLPVLSSFDKERAKYYQRARCLVRLHTYPVGLIELEWAGNELRPNEYASQIWRSLHIQINNHLRQDGLPAITKLTINGIASPASPHCLEDRAQFLAGAPFVSVIVPTHDRPGLDTCLQSLLALQYPRYEVIVVDNAPGTNAAKDLVETLAHNTPNIRYMREDRQGVSWARNCGITAARGEILAFTDDDVIVDAHWLTELVRGFQRDNHVACVTGLVLPLELDTPAQLLFEDVGGYGKDFERRIFDFKEDQSQLPLHPYIAERFGTGASMALTAAFLRSIEGFDPALGRVGPVRCAQDIAVFFQVLAHGYTLAYEPSSVIYHLHRREYFHLRKQTYNHAVGYTAYLTKSLLENPWLIWDFSSKIPFAFFITLRSRFAGSNKNLPVYAQVVQKELLALRRKGLLYGPLAYIRSRWELHRSRSKK